ncbi:hypothetical protein CRENBAI_014973 [Crenichthys baileyi]|uniref:Nesprin-1 spectrin repeats region domain-containing protein n=1 Tax=Crenichthys baileyi TaxID=28760 RepID=A0AAV9RAB8_9TELE
MSEWGSRHALLNEVGNFLMESTDPQTRRGLAEELRKLNKYWAEFVRRNTLEKATEPSADGLANTQDLHYLIREATLILKEPLEAMASPLRVYRKRLQVMQTLFEAEQVCAELQHSVSGLDTRLAELLLWEMEARELYKLLRTTDQQQKVQGQDPRSRVIISRGLQLEGQVVTEEQDLQEAIGLLSSLGANRDRSRSPSPSMVFIQAKAQPQHLRQSETRLPTHQSEMNVISHQDEETFVPKIVVQEHREEKMSPPMPYTYAQAVMQTGTGVLEEGQTGQDANAQKQQKTQNKCQIPQQQPLQEELTRKCEQEKQQPSTYKLEQKLEEKKEPELNPEQPQPCHDKPEEQDVHGNVCHFQIKQHTHTNVKEETLFKQKATLHEETLNQQPAAKKKHLSSQELQSRKAQAMKNRPWLQKTELGGKKSSHSFQKQGSAPDPIQIRHIKSQVKRESTSSAQVVSQHTSTGRAHSKSQVKVTKQTQQCVKVQQQDQQEKQRQDYPKQPHRPVRQTEPDSGTKTKSQVQSFTKPHVINQSEPNVQVKVQSVAQVQVQSRSPVYSFADSQQPPTTMSQQIFQQPQSPSQTKLLYGPQLPLHVQTGPPVRPISTIQAPLPGFIQFPVPSHIQLRSHPQYWAPVRPPSPKPPTTDRLETHGQQSLTQSHPQAAAPPQHVAYPQTLSQSITHPHQKTSLHTDALAIGQTQDIVKPMAGPNQPQTQIHHETQVQPVVPYQDHSASDPTTLPQPPVIHQGLYSQCQLQAWPQVRASSQMSIQHLQATSQSLHYPEIYPQPRFPSQQWAEKQELQNQAIPQQKHPVSQLYPQHIAQASHSQGYSTVQALPQWAQQATQISPHGYVLGVFCTQPQVSPQTNTQSWTQTLPQIRSQSHIQQSPQTGAFNVVQKEQGQIQQQTWFQPQPQPQPYQQPQCETYLPAQHHTHTQHHSHSQMQTQIPLQPQPPHPQLSTQNKLHTLQHQSQTETQTQLLLPSKIHTKTNQPQSNPLLQQVALQPIHSQVMLEPVIEFKSASPPLPKPLAQADLDLPAAFDSLTQTTGQSSAQPKTEPVTDHIRLIATATTTLNVESTSKEKEQKQITLETVAQKQPKVHSLPVPGVVSVIQPLPEPQVQEKPVVLSPTKADVESTQQSIVVSETSSQPAAQSQFRTSVQSVTEIKVQSLAPPKPQAQFPSQAQQLAQSAMLTKSQMSTPSRAQSSPQTSPKTQPVPLLTPHIQAESPDLFTETSSLAQAPSQAYTEAYVKAQALARNHFEEAKHCLQAHIMETISDFKDKCLSAEQASVKEETLKTLDPELLEEFLRAAKGMEAFCTPSQLKEMEFFTQSVQSQWEACFSADFAEAGQHLKVLKELCGTLSPEDAHRLAQTQLMECEKRLAAIQHQFSGDQDSPQPDSRVHQAFVEDVITQKESKKPNHKLQLAAEVTVQRTSEEKTNIGKQASVEEITKKEALERYETCKRTLQAHLAKTQQSFRDVPSDLISLKGLHTRLQEIQFLRQETELLWSEYANQCSNYSQFSGDSSLDQEKAELLELWRSQQTNLQRRGSSLGAALRQIDSTENHMVDFNDRLDRYLRQSKDITGFTLANTNILKDIKELHDNIQSELDQLSRLDPESSDLDPRECFPLTREVETHKASLDQLGQQVQKSEAAARALDRFLSSLRKVYDDISGVQGAPCSDSVVLQDCRSKLSLIRQSIDSLKEKAPQLDLLLQGARLTVTRDGSPASCLDMVTVLLRRLEEADRGLANQQRGLQTETQSKSIGLRKRIALGELRRLQDVIEKQGLKEPTMPAVQHTLRALVDLEGQLQAQQSEVQSLRELQEQQGGEENVLQDLEAQWEETQRYFFDR